jgi:hypothetical protein
MCLRALLIVVLKDAGDSTRDEYRDHLSAEKVLRVKLFRSRAAKFMRDGNFRNPNARGQVGKFQAGMVRGSEGLLCDR